MKKNILVLGGAGYIGSHMVKDLLRAGYEVVTMDNLSTGHRELLPGGIFYEGNLGDGKLLDRIFSEYQISAVMHFAAFSLVGDSMQNPLSYYRNNIAGTIELLAAMVRHNVKYFIFSSSAAVYGEPVEIPIKEEHPCNPTNPYGATKVAVEQLLNDCDYAYGLKSVSLRYFNAAGADKSCEIGELHEPETHLIPLVLKAASGEQKNIKIFGTDYPTSDGTCIRDYVHVSDLAQAHLLALEALLSGKESSVYNLGNSKGYSVRRVIELAGQITGKTIPTVEVERRPGDPAELVAASDKIRQDFGWKPVYEDLETIITTAWNWHTAEKPSH
ncbi:MAG: UDP-glucose 4-epimerase GalE [Deltaproteobacteria bacterium]|nr:UDP-glucose 4-epimerase GalE [Deltaproteobacteria bacterium]